MLRLVCCVCACVWSVCVCEPHGVWALCVKLGVSVFGVFARTVSLCVTTVFRLGCGVVVTPTPSYCNVRIATIEKRVCFPFFPIFTCCEVIVCVCIVC